MPIKSTGCAKCRKRKIRCDETRPGCNRCKTHGVPCPGYRLPAPGEVKFQDQTEWTVLSAHKTYGTELPSTKLVERKKTKDVFKNGMAIISLMPADGMDSGYATSTTPNSMTTPSTRGSLEPDEWGIIHHETNIDLATAMELYATPTLLPSPAIEKQLIYSTFLETYLPKSLPQRPRDRDAHFSIFQHLITTPDLRSEVSESLDALSLVQVGSVYRDKALLKQAVGAYSRALRGLVKTLSSEDFVQDDYVLATCTILSTCEFFDEIAQVGDGWSKHVDGCAQLMSARGPESMTSDLARLLFSNMKHGALSHALISRKSLFLGSPEWRAVAWKGPIPADASTYFYDIALQVPAILERHDKVDFEKADALQQVTCVLKAANKLYDDLKFWLWDLEVNSKFKSLDNRVYWLTPIVNFPTFTTLCKDRTVEEAFMFPGFMVAYIMSVYWDCMYFLRTTIQSLHVARHKLDNTWYPEPEEVVTEEEISDYVMNVVRCFPFFCEPWSSSTGQIGMFLPMYVAAMYFQKSANWKMLKWLGTVRDNVFTKGMRPPTMRNAATNDRAVQYARGTSPSISVGA